MAQALADFGRLRRLPADLLYLAPWRGWTASLDRGPPGRRRTCAAGRLLACASRPEALALLQPAASPGCALAVVARTPAYRLWQCQREGLPWDAVPPWQGEGACLTRPHDALHGLPAARVAACWTPERRRRHFEDAAAQALQAAPAADLARARARCVLRTGVPARPNPCWNRRAPHAHQNSTPHRLRACIPPRPARAVELGLMQRLGQVHAARPDRAGRAPGAGGHRTGCRAARQGGGRFSPITDTTLPAVPARNLATADPPEMGGAHDTCVAEHLFPVLLVLGWSRARRPWRCWRHDAGDPGLVGKFDAPLAHAPVVGGRDALPGRDAGVGSFVAGPLGWDCADNERTSVWRTGRARQNRQT